MPERLVVDVPPFSQTKPSRTQKSGIQTAAACRAVDPAVAISAVQVTEVERARRDGNAHGAS
jgi:hypothetical protein